jgi:Protein of unknown function (DUF2652)
MLVKPELAYFVIADISGYTSFLAGVELDHAQDIVADFMDTVVKALRPRFRLAKFEGDAAFVYAPTEKVDGSMLQDSIESAYFKFRRRMRDVKQASVCECKACVAMGNLDFKFVVHHGEMVKQKMGGREELAGRNVILVHRLLKNTVSEKFGNRAYALYSDSCIQSMGIDPVAHRLIEHRETVDIIGDLKVWLRDLEEARSRENEATRFEVTQEDAYVIFDFDIDGVGIYHGARPTGEMVADRCDHREHRQSTQRNRHRESLHTRQGGCRRGGARLAPVRLLYGKQPSSDPGRAEDRDDASRGGRAERRHALGDAGRQSQTKRQSLRR